MVKPWPEEVGALTFLGELSKTKAQYVCDCGKIVRRARAVINAAHLKGEHSACKTCGRKAHKARFDAAGLGLPRTL